MNRNVIVMLVVSVLFGLSFGIYEYVLPFAVGGLLMAASAPILALI